MPRNSDESDIALVPTIRLRTRQFDEIAEHKGWDSDAAAGRAIGVDGATVWRVRRGIANPGERFIAGLLLAVRPSWRFDDLFEIDACMQSKDAS